eukprot:3793792-Rhodomonas_salina.1
MEGLGAIDAAVCVCHATALRSIMLSSVWGYAISSTERVCGPEIAYVLSYAAVELAVLGYGGMGCS